MEQITAAEVARSENPSAFAPYRQGSCSLPRRKVLGVLTRLLTLNADPVFEDRVLEMLDAMGNLEVRIVRTLAEAIHLLMREDFDLLMIEGKLLIAIEQAIHARQHFPSLEIVCLVTEPENVISREQASDQNIRLMTTMKRNRLLRRELRELISKHARGTGAAAEGVDPCHSLIGNLDQFPAGEVLQMSCLGQRTGRFTFKSGRGAVEVFLHHGIIRHALYDSLEGEPAVAEVFRWRQGRFFFEEGIISQIQTVNRPWPHLMLDNMQKLDEAPHLVGASAQR
jgi:hypothetical protein